MAKETTNNKKTFFHFGKSNKTLINKKVKAPYIPYRDSKLTMLLMDSLGYYCYNSEEHQKHSW